MSQQAKKQYLIAILERYQKAGRIEKGLILNEFCAICGYSRKYAIRLLNSKLRVAVGERRGRKPTYDAEVRAALKELWYLTGKVCSKRLRAAIPEWVWWYKRHQKEPNDVVIKKLLSISPASIDRHLKELRREEKKGRSLTRKSNWWFRAHIPIRADNDGITEPGFVQADTVGHCGNAIGGEYAHTITATDVLTTWTETQAIWKKESVRVCEAFPEIEKRFPFPFVILKSDSGTEFMNDRVYTFLTCRDFPVQLVRSRPYQKNDQCYVEQKNFTHVRNLFGYIRIDHTELVERMNEIYCEYWNPLQNFFIPTMKLLSKERINSRWKKKFDKPRTPFQRVLECVSVSEEKKNLLRERKARLNPIELRLKLEAKLKEFFDLTKQLTETNSIKIAA